MNLIPEDFKKKAREDLAKIETPSEYFNKQLVWSKSLDKQAIKLMYKILQRHLKVIINIKRTPLEIDREFATDLTLFTFKSNSVAVRMRRIEICKTFRDLTIQTQQSSGNRYNTEYIKIFEKGYVRWYLYCWTKNDKIMEWMFVDLDILRQSRIINFYNEITNKNDNQLFKAIPFKDLLKYECIIEYNIKKQRLFPSNDLEHLSQLNSNKKQINLLSFIKRLNQEV